MPTVLFIHGFLDGAQVWADSVAQLDGSTIRPATLDLVGMGARASEGGPFTLERFATDVAREVEALQGPVILVGHSMGAQIAELVAAQLPQRVAALVLLTPVPLAGTHLPDSAIQPFRALGGKADAQREVRRQLSSALPPARLEMLGQIGDLAASDAVAAFADAWNQGHADGGEPSKYQGPVLVLRGADDPFITEEVVRTGVAPRFAKARLETIANAGHWAHVEQPDAFARALAAFIADLGEAAPSQGWTQAFEQKSSEAFAQAFAPDVVLEASAMTRAVHGADNVKAIMGAASNIYEALVFTTQATNGHRTYLEWEARAFGGEQIYGVTILTKNAQGEIVRAAIHHRPLRMALRFSVELGRRLRDQVGTDLFFAAS